MFVIVGLPYGIVGGYDFLQGQGFLPDTYPLLSELIPTWVPPLLLGIGIMAFVAITFEGAYRIVRKERGKASEAETEGNKMAKKARIFSSLLKTDDKYNRIHKCSQCGWGVVISNFDTGIICPNPNCGNVDDISPKL